MEKSTQALMTFEKDNQRLRKELKQAKQNQVQQSSDKEVETLKYVPNLFLICKAKITKARTITLGYAQDCGFP